jgi:anaerobic selenocysteine-containing dehydrogenase
VNLPKAVAGWPVLRQLRGSDRFDRAPVPSLGTSFGRGGATTFQQDLQNADCILIQGSNMAEAHPVGFQWVMEARLRGAKVIHVDPRFSRTSAMAALHVPIRAGSDIAFLGGIVNYILSNRRELREYVVGSDNDFCFDYLPRLTGDHSIFPAVLGMLDGGVMGFFLAGENPAVGSVNGGLQRKAMANLDWLVVRDLVEVESATFWRDGPEIQTGELQTDKLRTEVFLPPAAAHTEKDGSFTNTQRLPQWHQPEFFCEVSPVLARQRGLEHGGWATIVSARTRHRGPSAGHLAHAAAAPRRPGGAPDRPALPLGRQRPGHRRLRQRPLRHRAGSQRAHPGEQDGDLRHPPRPKAPWTRPARAGPVLPRRAGTGAAEPDR